MSLLNIFYWTFFKPTELKNLANRNKAIEKRLDNKTGITLKEFKSFFFFLNNLESFATAIHYYALANQPIGPC